MEEKLQADEELVSAKKELRKKMKSLCGKITEEDRNMFSEKAASLFLNSDIYRNSSSVLCFISSGTEIDTSKIIAKCLIDNKRIAVPRIIPGTSRMDFYVLKNLPLSRQTEVSTYGLIEPLKSLEKIQPHFLEENAVLIVPGLAFTRDGRRLGRGKGFYDCYIRNLKQVNSGFRNGGVLAGLGYSFQIVEDIPCAAFDERLNYIISDQRFESAE